MVGVVIAVAEEEEVIDLWSILFDVPDERRTRRPLGIEPLQLVEIRVLLLEDALGARGKELHVPLAIDREALDRDPVDGLRAGRIVVVPGDVIARAGRQHDDLRVRRQMLGDIARVQLSAAVDVGAIALHHDGQLHCSGP